MSQAPFERLRDRLLSAGAPSVLPRPRSERLSPEEASFYIRMRPFAQAMYVVMAADGKLDPKELDTLRGALRRLTAGTLGSAAMESMLAEFQEAGPADPELHLDRIAAELYGDRDDAELAVSLALAAGAADNELLPEERAIIEGLAERLGIPRRRMAELEGLHCGTVHPELHSE